MLPETKKALILGVVNLALAILVFLIAVAFYYAQQYFPILSERILFPLDISIYTFLVTAMLLFTMLFFLKFLVEFSKVFDRASLFIATYLTKEFSTGGRVLKDIVLVLTMVVFMTLTPLIKDVLFRDALFGEIAYLTVNTVIATLMVMFLYDALKQIYVLIEKKLDEYAKRKTVT
ncbi:MAG: hypothetical protein QXL15_02265 [Candidatus Korarchaeota archaeon]